MLVLRPRLQVCVARESFTSTGTAASERDRFRSAPAFLAAATHHPTHHTIHPHTRNTEHRCPYFHVWQRLEEAGLEEARLGVFEVELDVSQVAWASWVSGVAV